MCEFFADTLLVWKLSDLVNQVLDIALPLIGLMLIGLRNW